MYIGTSRYLLVLVATTDFVNEGHKSKNAVPAQVDTPIATTWV